MTTERVTDLRSYLTVLEQAGELSRVKVPVSLDQEIGAICLRNLRAGGPGLLFERPGDRAMPLAVDLLASRRRYALALGIEPDQLAAEWNRRTTKTRNVGLYRNQVHDRETLGILAAPYTHLNLQRNKAPNEPFPVALVLGPDPTVVMTAPAPIPFGTDELAIAGALRGKPLELVTCKTIPLEVPGSAE